MANSPPAERAGNFSADSLQSRICADFDNNETFLYATLKLLIEAAQKSCTGRSTPVDGVTRAIGDLQKQVSYIYRRVEDSRIRSDLYYQDLMLMLSRLTPITRHPPYSLETAHPVAVESDDHKHPHGTAQDNTRSQRFVAKCAALYPDGLQVLDLGCAGGGLVLDFLLAGHRAIGLEGSDFSLRTGRAAWRLVPEHLRTCDITQPFTIRAAGDPARFRVISAWEVLEHIEEAKLPQLFKNISDHLAEDGVFVGSVNCLPDEDKTTGAQYHVTVRDRNWWHTVFLEHGLMQRADPSFEPYDYPRGTRNGLFDSSDYHTQPNRGFHFVMQAR